MKITNGSIEYGVAGLTQENHVGEKLTVLPCGGTPANASGEDGPDGRGPEYDEVYAKEERDMTTYPAGDDSPSEKNEGRVVKKIKRFNKFIDATVVGLDAFTALLWLVLYRAEKNGIATVTHGRLAKLTGKSKRTVARHIQVLIANKLLKQVHTGGYGRGYNKYKFGLQPLAKDNPLRAYKQKAQSAEPTEQPAASPTVRRKPK